MNKRFPIYLLLGIMFASVLFSCGGDDDDAPYEFDLVSSVAVTEFYLSENSEILNNLDSVFFTIDLNKAEIYNADSLPKGTDVSGLEINMTYVNCSSAQFHVTGGKWMKDTTFVYNSGDSIDFTGDVKFTIISQDLTASRTYTIKVNVHEMEPDSLYWNRTSRRDLPSYSNYQPKEQKTVQYHEGLYCLMRDAVSCVLAITSDPASNKWTRSRIELPFEPKVETFTATSDALYMLDVEGELYKSVDGFAWSSCGTSWYSVSGSYGDRMLGVIYEDGVYKHTEYPMSAGFEPYQVSESFPIEGVSPMVTISSKWAVSEQRMIIGGVTVSGVYTGHSWGYDGEEWGQISRRDILESKGVTLIDYRYFSVDTENNWSVTEYPTLFAMGGVDKEGEMQGMVYVSNDRGMNWYLGGELVQLPDYIEDFAYAQAFVYNSTLTTESRSESTGWISMPATKLPSWYSVCDGVTSQSRVTTAITSWECPYIYLFGGTDIYGNLHNNIWRGVVNRLSFKPLY